MSMDDTSSLSYAQAMNQAFSQIMGKDSSIFLIGQGVKSPWYVGSTTKGLLSKFGENRVIDTPVSENAITGAAVGAAVCGMKPVIVHPRMDFMMYAMDPIINEAANWSYMFGGRRNAGVVIWAIVNRGGEQGAQHSQSIHSVFAHIPGLKVVMPSTPFDAKGLMVSAIYDLNPVIFIDDRWLYNIVQDVPEELYSVPIGKAALRREGKDLTIVGASYMINVALGAAEELSEEGIEAEVIDLRSIKPLDKEMIFASVKKTGRLIIVDGGWRTCGFSGEISALATENCFDYLRCPICRITLPDIPAPSSAGLEDGYYPKEKNIISAAKKCYNK